VEKENAMKRFGILMATAALGGCKMSEEEAAERELQARRIHESPRQPEMIAMNVNDFPNCRFE
jgi:hypothetical protein